MLTEDHTATVLSGLPIFLTNRTWTEKEPNSFTKNGYFITLRNDVSVSVIEFFDWKFSGGQQYELLANLPKTIAAEDYEDIMRGSATDINDILFMLEKL